MSVDGKSGTYSRTVSTIMTKTTKIALGAFCTFICSVGTSHAALIDRGGGLIYDDALDVTWMQDAGYARTVGLSERMTWADANAFADGVQFYDSVRNVTWDDWRLPTTVNAPSSAGWDTTGLSSELAFMYYVNLGYAANTSFNPADPAPTSSNYNPFFNLAYRGFWSATADYVTGLAWGFHFHFGVQQLNGMNDGSRVWLVRNGDVAFTSPASSVPEPGTLGLFGLALAGIGFSRRKKA
jgi:hypothetical protein